MASPERKRSILHVDMDAFYASVEVLDDPSLRGKPVCVGGSSSGRGVVTSASYEARRYGVRSPMNAAQVLRLCPEAVFVRGNMKRYVEVSKQIFEIFKDFSPLVQGMSIDEAFLDVTGCEKLLGPPEEIALEIKRRIRDEVGLTASVGVAPNKFLAKIASDMDKPDGLMVLHAETAAEQIADLPVGALMGIGKVAQKKLKKIGIHRVRHVQEATELYLSSAVGGFARTLKRLSLGLDERPVRAGRGRKSIGCQRTFFDNIGDEDELVRRLDSMVERVAGTLRKKGWRARTVTVKARFPDFTNLTRSHTLDRPEDRTKVLRETARRLLREKVDRGGHPLRLLGVTLSNLVEVDTEQGTLFPEAGEVEERTLDRAVDRIRDSFGKDALMPASQVKRGEGKKP